MSTDECSLRTKPLYRAVGVLVVMTTIDSMSTIEIAL